MEDRGPFRFLAPVVSRQSNQRGQDYRKRAAADQKQSTLALKMAASTLRISNTYLGAQFRRLRTRLGAPIAIKAMAAKLARLVYRMLRYGIRFVDHGAEFYEAQHRRQQIHYLKWKAAKLGLQITEAPAA
jgi:transposase